MSAPVHSLFVTLKRSFAGTREHHVRILQSLGLRYRQHTVEKPNAAHVRGAVDKASCRGGAEGRGGGAAASRLPPFGGDSRPARPENVCLSLDALQVRHMLLVETDVQRQARLAVEAARRAPRPPVTVRH